VSAPAQSSALALDKAAVSRNFSSAAGGYDEAAAAQDEIAERLVRALPLDLSPTHLVELGCGTGLLAARLLRRFPAASLRGLDLAGGMIEACQRRFAAEPRARFEVADAEDPRACAGPVDLVAASCSAQWFVDPEGTLRRWGRALAPGGLVAAALLVRGSYAELDAAHRAAHGAPFAGLAFPAEEEVPALLRRAGLSPRSIEADSVAVGYRSARDALASFRGIGAVLRGQPGRGLGAGGARRLLAAYERLSGPGGARVTHRVVWAVSERAP
jgi:malonyl-CoA O-methyltransferase